MWAGGCLTLLALPVLLVLALVASMMSVSPSQMLLARAGTGPCQLNLRVPESAGILSEEQLRNATVIVRVGQNLGVAQRGWVVALAAAYQESRLRSVGYGDRDSRGLFQQRPSAGWGTPEQVTNPRYAARAFYGAKGPPATPGLTQIGGWQAMSIAQAAQAVQRSAFPDAYAQWAGLARTLVSRITHSGGSPGTVQASSGGGCPTGPGTGPEARPDTIRTHWPPEAMLRGGLTPRTTRVLRLVQRRFPGVDSIGGYCRGGCTSGHTEGSDHYSGQAIDVMTTNKALGDRIARYLIRHQAELGVHYLIWRNQIWNADMAGQGWRGYCPDNCPFGATSDPTALHHDHVHISVY